MPRSFRRSRRIRPTTWTGLAVLALVAGGCVSNDAYENLEAERDALARDLETARSEIDALQAVNQDLETRVETRDVALAATTATYSALADDLQQELVAGQVKIEQLQEGIRVQLKSDVLFESGSAKLDEKGRAVITSVSDELAAAPYRIEVEGHTDDTPIGPRLSKTWASNWELAAARSSRVVELLQENGVPADKLVAVSFGETRPVASNETAEGQSENRRIEIRLIPAQSELPAVAAPPPTE